MKKPLLLAIISLFALSGVSVNAKVRTSAEVLTIAEQHFATQKAATRAAAPKIVKTILASEVFPQTRAKGSSSGEPFYVVVASNGSHVIISGDDLMPQLIGYSDYKFDKDHVNEGLKMLLSAYCSAYDDIQATGVSKLETAPQSYASTAFPTEVTPLLDGIAYDQAEPYNGMSPILSNGRRGYTGCVTTAMAMVMRYYQYPERAKGRGVGDINNIDLSEHPLLWDKMLKTYAENNTTNPKENRDAIAWLMRSCGAALGTVYMLGSSGSGERMIAPVFADNFGYDQGVVNISRDDKTLQQWTELIKTELAAKRPIVYLATQADQPIGHAVVIDGYDSRGMYYVNWGWTTSGNGYYGLNLGTNYITGQGLVVGIQKPTGAPYVSKFSKPSGGLNIKPTTTTRTGAFELVENWDYFNRGDTFTGDIALVLFKDGKFVTKVGTAMSCQNILRNGDVIIGFKGATIPESVANGRYELYLASKAATETTWNPFAMDVQNMPYYQVDITSSQIVLTSPVAISTPKLVSFETNSKLYFREYVDFKVKMQYEGTEVDAFIKVVLTSRETGKVIELNLSRTVMNSGGTYEVQFTKLIGYNPGDYKVDVLFSEGGSIYAPLVGADAVKDLTIYPENFEKYDYFVLASSVQMEKSTITNKEKPRLILELKNLGSKDIDGAELSLMTSAKDFYNVDWITLSIKKDETKKVVLESQAILKDADDYTYRVQIKYPSGGILSGPSAIRNAGDNYPFSIRTLADGK